MNHMLAMEMLTHLTDCGLSVVVAGGAARDSLHNVTPKDFDICVLGPGIEVEEAIDFLDISGVSDLVPFGPGASMETTSDANLDWVIKFSYRGVSFDLIQFATQADTPEQLVEMFDCTLNMAWLTADGTMHQHDDFPPLGGKVRFLPRCDFPLARSVYLQSKYPQYQWPTLAEIQQHPNYKGT